MHSNPTPHHCPVCGVKNDMRCITARGHMVQCPIHQGTYHGTFNDCVRCLEAERRAERAQRKEKREEDKKENQKPKKTPKAKPASAMKIKEQRRRKSNKTA